MTLADISQRGRSGWSSSAWFAATRPNATWPRWLSAMAPRRPSPTGTHGFSAANAAAVRSTSPLAKHDDREV